MAGRLQQKTVNINFPFEVGDVETIELYRYAGAPVSAEKKVVDAEETIKDLYDMFEGLTLELKEVEENCMLHNRRNRIRGGNLLRRYRTALRQNGTAHSIRNHHGC